MFTQPLTAGNMTLASLNTTLYSPTNPSKSDIRPFGANPQSRSFQDNFQSNGPFRAPPGSAGLSGLGIIFPMADRTRHQDDTPEVHKLGSGHETVHRYRTFMRTESTYDSQVGSSIYGDPVLEHLTLSSWLDPAEFLREDLDVMDDEPVIGMKQEPALHAAPPQPPASIPAEEQGRWVLQRILEASGHTVESLSAELKARFGGLSCSAFP